MVYKKVTELTLRNGEKVHVTLAEGNSVRQAKASERSKSIMFPSLNNRMLDSSFIVDVQDKSVEDHTQPELIDHTKGLIAAGLLEPEPDLRLAPGYIKYVVAGIKLRKGKNTAAIKAKLDEEQLKLVEAEMQRQGVTW